MPVQLVGVGKETHINSLSNWTNGNDAPVCADESPFNTWSNWNAGQRDLFILDQNDSLIFHENITSGIPDNLEELVLSMLNPTTVPCALGDVYVSEGHTSGTPEDYIELYNSGDSDCSLEGFQLDDSEDLEDFTFGDVVIQAGGYWAGYEDQNNSFTSGLSAGGDIIVFADPDNNSLTVTLEESQELEGVELSQSFDANGIGCYTNPTPGNANGDCVTLSNDEIQLLPEKVTLYQNYPNPFNPTTQIKYDLPEDARVSITIYDVMGRQVKSLVSTNQRAGYRSIQWDATNNLGEPVSAGMYIYTIQTGDFRATKKMMLLK